MTVHWKRWAIIVSIAWAIVGGNAGVQLAVAPAVSAYRHCVTSQAADAGVCHAALQRDWADQSGDRLGFAALIGLAPIPVGWLISGWYSCAGAKAAPQVAPRGSPGGARPSPRSSRSNRRSSQRPRGLAAL